MNRIEQNNIVTIGSILKGATPENIKSYGGRLFEPCKIVNDKHYKIKNEPSVFGCGIYKILIRSNAESSAQVKISYSKNIHIKK